jgi:NADH-quinone oxidoreductase subunit A
MTSWIFLPPVAASLLILVLLFVSRLMKSMACRGETGAGAESSYACGEEAPKSRSRPEYGQFFPYAFFFTIMHVAALVLATVPSGALGPYLIAALYIAAAFVGLRALLRSES